MFILALAPSLALALAPSLALALTLTDLRPEGLRLGSNLFAYILNLLLAGKEDQHVTRLLA